MRFVQVKSGDQQQGCIARTVLRERLKNFILPAAATALT
jgi:hypothetical protein